MKITEPFELLSILACAQEDREKFNAVLEVINTALAELPPSPLRAQTDTRASYYYNGQHGEKLSR